MPQLTAYLIFGGNCAEAMRFYQRALGGKLDLLTHGDSPIAAQTPPGSANLIMHARLVNDGLVLMASDSMVGEPYEGMKGFSVSLVYPAAAEARKAFDALAQGGRVTLPMGKTFWSEAFGMVTDRFGTPWMVNGAMQAT
jgi:PhnB protein